MARIPIGLELYSVRHDLANDAHGTLKAVAEMGYDGVEFAGELKHSPEELRGLLDEFGLECCGWHIPFARVQPDRLDESIHINRTLGNRFLIVPGIPAELRTSRADWLKLAGFFNTVAERLAGAGMVTGYHNHHIEFTPLEGEKPWDTFFGNTQKDVVMQLDTGNALRGGANVVEILERYPGRPKTIHLKPYSFKAGQQDPEEGFRPLIGEDDTPWSDVFRLCESVGETQWYIVEYESDAYPPLDAVRRCLDNLKAMGK